MEHYMNDFITYLREIKHASVNTLQAYQNDLKKLQLFCEKHSIRSVTKISETFLNSYVLSLEKDGLSPSSVSRNIAALKAFILYLLRQGIIQGDPSERIKPPKVQKKAPQIIETAAMNKLLDLPGKTTVKGLRDRAILELLYATGIKVSELTALKLSDVNFTAGYIICREQKERAVPFGNSAKKALKEYIEVRNKNLDKKESDYLFLNSCGDKLSRQGLWKILKAYAKTAGLTGINPNSFRNSFAAHMLENGADIGSVQEFLGHADITTTQVYLKQGYKNSREVYKNTHPRA